MSSKVNIVMSAYNGEQYIREQMESLLNQDYDHFEIYVRDDGSKDGTLRILKEYEEKHGVHVIAGENKGFSASFFDVLSAAEDGDYWSFCDQDDIWFPDKLKMAVQWLDTQKQDKPLLYYSLSEMFDESGKNLGIQEPPKGSLCFRRAMTGTFGVGFSMVINRQLRDEMLKCDPYRVHSHDWLAGAIALGFGKVHVNHKICARYRRLTSSVTRISLKKKVQWALSMLRENGDVAERNQEYIRVFKEKLSQEKIKTAELFENENDSLKTRLKKVFYPKRWRPGISSELVMRFLMLIGKV